MKNKLKYILFALLVTFTLSAQTKQQADTWLSKPWQVQYSFENGKKIIPNQKQKNDGITFYSNAKFSMTQGGEKLNGIWKYSESKKAIELNITSLGIKTNLKLVKLTANELIYETQYEDGTIFKYHLTPQLKK